MKTNITLAILLFMSLAHSQTVTTFTDGNPDDAIAIDSNNNIFVSGFNDGIVYRFTPSGSMSQFIIGLANPNGLDFDASDNLYVSQWDDNKISRYLINGTLDNDFSSSGNPSGIIKAFNNDDIIFTRYSGNTIHRMSPNGFTTLISSATELDGPVGLAYDENGVLYVGNYNTREIYRVLSGGSLEYVATVGSASNLGFITFAQGKLWGTVLGEHKIYVIEPSEIDNVSVFAGSEQGTTDGSLSEATFDAPNGILFSNDETIMYVSEFNSKNLRIISNINLSTEAFDELKNNVQVTQNLSQKILTISGLIKERNSIHIDVTNILGKQILKLSKTINQTQFNEQIKTDNWQSGVYVIRISSGRFSKVIKIVIQ